jgi:hypothetical protein
MTDMVKFNVNSMVKVKLTDIGWGILRDDRERMKKGIPTHDWSLPKPDEDGYLTYQFWCFMQLFGPHIHMGMLTPFETDILLVPS